MAGLRNDGSIALDDDAGVPDQNERPGPARTTARRGAEVPVGGTPLIQVIGHTLRRSRVVLSSATVVVSCEKTDADGRPEGEPPRAVPAR